ncbi:MAG: hypothetical protein ABI690_23385 [Chloroflexota bacterium]
MKKHGLLILLVLALCALLISPAFAQSADQDLIDYVKGAFDQFFTLDTYSSSGTQNIVQHISVVTQGQTVVVDQTIDQDLDGQVANDAGKTSMAMQIDQNIAQVIGAQNQEIKQTLEIVLTDGGLFMRFSNVSPATMAAIFPKDWVNLVDDPNAFPGASAINAEQYANVFSSQFKYPLTAETVERIKELPGETLDDGTETRVIKLVFNGPALFASGEMDQYLSAFNTASMGVDMDQLREGMGKNAALELTLWIGTDDNMIYRQDVSMTLSGDMGAIVKGIDSMSLEQQVTGSILFADFNEPVTIEAPKVKS